MPSPPILDISALLPPIPGEHPAGGEVPVGVDQQLRKARETKQRDPQTGQPTEKKADWEQIIKVATEQLISTSKDLPLATRLVEALVKQHGVAGLRDGLRLIRRMVEECWDRMRPIPDPDMGEGMEIRSDLLTHALADRDYGVVFPLTVEQMPIVLIDGTPHSLYDKKLADDGKGPLPADRFANAKPLNDVVYEDLKETLEEYKLLDEGLVQKLESDAPNLRKLEEVLNECHEFLKHVVGEPDVAPPEEENGSTETPETMTSGSVPVRGRSQEELYHQLEIIANELARLQPNNLAVSLIRRAIRIGKMSPEELIEELVRDDGARAEKKREFGVETGSADE